MDSVVKKQHYIWRKYLRPWTDNQESTEGSLYVWRKQTRGTQASTEYRKVTTIGFENYYYDMTNFSDKDKTTLQAFLAYMQKDFPIRLEIRPEVFEKAVSQKDFMEKEVMCLHEDIENEGKFLKHLINKDYSFYEDSSIQKFMFQLKKEIWRRIFYQCKSIPDNELIRRGTETLKNFDGENPKFDFNKFFYMQYFRTPKRRQELKNSFEEFKRVKNHKDLDTRFFINMLSLYVSARVSLTVTQRFHTAIWLFDNQTETPFITGDSPIMNLFKVEEDSKTSIMYYPVSPKVAIMLATTSTEIRNTTCVLDNSQEELVKELNQRLALYCLNEIYSDNKPYLESLRQVLSGV
mgnify:CR=1 FL=1